MREISVVDTERGSFAELSVKNLGNLSMRTLVMLAAVSLIAVSVSGEASAQASRSMVASRVMVTVPERRAAAVSSSTIAAPRGVHGDAARAWRGLAGDGIGAEDCLATLELPGIGRLSVSCLETADAADRSAGVAFELQPGPETERPAAASRTIELHLADGAVVRLHGRAIAGGSGALYATIPAAAFQRIVEPRMTIVHAGRIHAFSDDESRALRGVAEALGR